VELLNFSLVDRLGSRLASIKYTCQALHRLLLPATNHLRVNTVFGPQFRKRHLPTDRFQRYLRLEPKASEAKSELYRFLVVFMPASLLSGELIVLSNFTRPPQWMGGPVPLGYQVESRKLVVNEVEAELVRHIYQRYLEMGSVVELADELNGQGFRTKVQVRASGPHRGGCSFQRGTLYHLLSNRIYIGQMVHKEEFFDGEHPAIVPIDLWDAVQSKMKANASGTSRRLKSLQPSLLVGLVFDGEGRAMTPSHATKPGRRYRYYITRPDQLDDAPAWRVSAYDLEQIICDQLSALLTD